MASYRDKINQKCFATESGKIAWAIKFIETGGFRFRKDWLYSLREGNEVMLFDDISVREGNNEFIYVIVKPVDLKPNRYLCKYIQQGMTYDGMVAMLDAQPWQYI